MFMRMIVGVVVVCVFLCANVMYGQEIIDQMIEIPVKTLEVAWESLVGAIIFILLAPIVCAFALFLFWWLVNKMLHSLWNVIFGNVSVSANVKVPGTPISASVHKQNLRL